MTQATVLIDSARTTLDNERLLAAAALHSQEAAERGLVEGKPTSASGGHVHLLPDGTPTLRFLSRRGIAEI